MDTKTIAKSINDWKAISTQGDRLVAYLGQGDYFFYNFPDYIKKSQHIHAYPAIHNDRMVFLLIPSEYDNEIYKDEISRFVEVCPLTFGFLGESFDSNRIPSSIARERIKLWQNNYTEWAPEQATSPNGIFMAFTIAIQDFEVKDAVVSMALKANGEEHVPYTADMIVTNRAASVVYYDDYSRPVPPFGPTATSSSFYLLSL